MSDVSDAARLLAYAMKPRLTPGGESSGEYARLVARHAAEATFTKVVEDVADGLGLWLVAVDPIVGAVACAEEDSSFAMGLRDYAAPNPHRRPHGPAGHPRVGVRGYCSPLLPATDPP